MILLSIFFSSLQSSLKQFGSDILLFSFFLLILLEHFIVILVQLLPIVLPLFQYLSLLLTTLHIDLLQEPPFLIRILCLFYCFLLGLSGELRHELVILLDFQCAIIIHFLHLFMQEFAQRRLIL